jgi:Ca2+-binding RTX toxin-like protein
MYVLENRPGDNGLYGGVQWTKDGARDAFIAATNAWSAVANISFRSWPFSYQEGDDPGAIDWVERLTGPDSDPEILGTHSLPSSGVMVGEYNNETSLFTEENNHVGGYSYVTFLHEIGHGLGLLHPHDGPLVFPGVDGSGDPGDLNLTQGIYSVMSYVDAAGRAASPSDAYGWWGTPMAFDIAAIQHLYGPNVWARSGDNVYALPKANASGTYWSCIWDVGGADTISAGGATRDCTIDLRPASLLKEAGGGGWISSLNGIFGGFTIANGVVIENATGGNGADTIRGNGVANLLIGNAGNDAIAGGDGADRLQGGDGADTLGGDAGNDIIEGGAGADTMRGAAGNDVYSVDNVSDKVIETSADGGTDTVRSSISYTLGTYQEKLVLTGTGTLKGTGNNLANSITGNGAANLLDGGSGNDVLDGGAGADSMSGGAGNDTYVIDNAGDTAFEASAAGGTDTVRSAVTSALGANVENLVLTGSATANATGNVLANALTGNAAANILDGRGGADTMTGGGGNDVYAVDSVLDKVVETSATGGSDTVRSALAYTLGVNVENLLLTASAAVSGTGNGLANRITGNGAANILKGGSGADTLDGAAGSDALFGGSGKDSLEGGGGADEFTFDSALGSSNVDVILDFYAPSDSICLSRTIFTAAGPNGRLSSLAFCAGTAAADRSDRIVYDQAAGKIFYDADGSGAAAQILFATVAPGTLLGYSDFVVYG